MSHFEASTASNSFLNEMLNWISGRGKKILIIVHDNPDPDCLASAIALRHLLTVRLGRDAVIAFSGIIARSENLAMAKELQIPLTPLSILDLSDFQVICMLDTQPGSGNNSLPEDIKVDIVIDHHPIREASRKVKWVDIREEYGVTATILYEYLHEQGVSINTKLATALFYAIKSETQDLGREAQRPDREAYLNLFPLANKKLLYEITLPTKPIEYFRSLHSALEHTVIYDSLLTADIGCVHYPEVVAELADILIRLENIETVLCFGKYNDSMILSLRTLDVKVNAGESLRGVMAGTGFSGGHGMMAGGKVDNVSSYPGGYDLLAQRFSSQFYAIMGKHDSAQEKHII